MAVLGALLLVLLALSLPAVLWLRSIGLLKASSPGEKVHVVIPKGSGTSTVGDLLEAKGVIPSSLGFRIAVYLEGGADEIQAGDYVLPTDLSAKDALAALLEGPRLPEVVRVTFPEGSWLEEFGEILDANTHISGSEFLELATTGAVRSSIQPPPVRTLEGLLFPATYEVSEKDDARSVATRLVSEFEERLRALDGVRRARALGITPYEAAIVASMIEAEAYVDKERPLIASVIYNRLDLGMALGIDATIVYATGERDGPLTSSELEIDSPFNTREHTGLPPTPIGAPGEESLRAALEPARTDLLYYVLADCEGHHAFSEDYDQFVRDKAVYEALDC